MIQNSSLTSGNSVAERVALRSLASRGETYAGEVQRLLDAGLEVMRRCGTTSRPRVADIVTAAGLSNDAFYRHFRSKDALVAALLEDGTDRLRSYLAHQMGKEATPGRKLRRWVEGVLSQAGDEDIAATTLAVLWNAGSLSEALPTGPPTAAALLASPLVEPFTELGSRDPELDSSLVAHAVVGKLTDYLWLRKRPGPADIDHIAEFCLGSLRR